MIFPIRFNRFNTSKAWKTMIVLSIFLVPVLNTTDTSLNDSFECDTILTEDCFSPVGDQPLYAGTKLSISETHLKLLQFGLTSISIKSSLSLYVAITSGSFVYLAILSANACSPIESTVSCKCVFIQIEHLCCS